VNVVASSVAGLQSALASPTRSTSGQ
jgi:hypothetical protein